MRNHDLVFLKHFSQVIGFLVVITIALILLGLYFNSKQVAEANPVVERAVAERIRPVAGVYAGSTGAAAQAAAKSAASAAAAAGPLPYDGTLDGSVIYGNLCSACHGTGAGGAPKLEKAAWAARIAQGMDVLNDHAINGYQGPAGLMPAKGGNPALSDEQVVATVQWMVDNLK